MSNINAVILDYGHGGNDPGACAGDYKEKIWNYETGKACREELLRHNMTVYETRTADQTLSLEQRCKIANSYNAMFIVSIHHNAGGGDRGEVIHSISNSGKPLAERIANELQVVGQSTNKVYSKKSSTNNKDYYGIIRGTNAISVIVEVCFIDNTEDRKIADTLSERKRNGVAIAHAILKQMNITIKQLDFDTYYRVICGSYNERGNAEIQLRELKKVGFDNCFIDIYRKS